MIATKPKRPEINRSSPRARGIEAALPCYEGGGSTTRDIASRRLNCTSIISTQTSDGGGLYFGGSDYLTCTNTPKSGAGDFAVAAVVRPGGGAGNRNIVRVDGGGTRRLWALWLSTAGAYEFVTYASDLGAPIYATSTTTAVVGRLDHVVGMRVGGVQQIYINGVLEGSTATFAAADYSARPFGIGYEVFGTSEKWVGHIHDVRLWGRALTAREIADDRRDPWALYRPLPRIIGMVPASAKPWLWQRAAHRSGRVA